MTDIEKNRIDAICEIAHIKDIGNLSDGFHTFNQLYYQRMMLFAAIVKQNKEVSWKSLRHEDGELCFGGGWFIVGVDTPEGSYTYHYENQFYDYFDCQTLERAKHWDGHTERDVTRLLSLPSIDQDLISRQVVLALYNKNLETSECGTMLNDEQFLKDFLALPPTKQRTPKMVIYYSDDYAECPTCGYHYETGDKDCGEPFCAHCGQPLKWEEDANERS